MTVFFATMAIVAYRWQPREWRRWLVFWSLFATFTLVLTGLSAMGHVFYGL